MGGDPYFRWSIEVAKILEVETTVQDQDLMGRVVDGYLRMSGRLQQSRRKIAIPFSRHLKNGSTVQFDSFDAGYTKSGMRPLNCNTYFFLMAYPHGWNKAEVVVEPTTGPVGYVFGSILESVDLRTATFRRIGVFRHQWGDLWRSKHDPGPKEYPEFIDFDPENFEHQTITIR